MDTARFRTKLLTRREELVQQMSEWEAELDETPSPDFADRATEREDDEVLEDLGLAAQRELRAIDAALGRIEDGEYGICTRCGEAISEARLEAVPTAALCRNCAR
ncbi:TraR/DksA family transcriptional regulator [Aquicoccus sp. SCR17]|nr:TraR/DksA family transcriptional regulator [Carideicomes alvinocaridis]